MERVLAGQDLLYVQKTKRFEEYLGTKWVRPDLGTFFKNQKSAPILLFKVGRLLF